MTLFEPAGGEPRSRAPRRVRAGWYALGAALVLGLVMAMLPAPYVIEQPGPVYDTLGSQEQDGEQVPLISIEGAETYPTAGTLDMLTVSVRGTRESRPSWAEILTAWFNPQNAVLPIDQVYPPNVTTEQQDEQNATLMVDSQQEAVAAALTQEDIGFDTELAVAAVDPGGPADGALEEDDVITAVNGSVVADLDALRAALAANGTGTPAAITVQRDGAESVVEVVPELSEVTDAPAIGIGVTVSYTFPFDVEIQLDNVGGPSAGMMFALGIIDKLTPGELNGGENVAGTGTIDAAGEVGPIGGIRQKMYGAKDAGAEWFLAPASNCGEVVGNVPDGLTVFAVSTLDDSMAALDAISSGSDTSGLATCETVTAG